MIYILQYVYNKYSNAKFNVKFTFMEYHVKHCSIPTFFPFLLSVAFPITFRFLALGYSGKSTIQK